MLNLNRAPDGANDLQMGRKDFGREAHDYARVGGFEWRFGG